MSDEREPPAADEDQDQDQDDSQNQNPPAASESEPERVAADGQTNADAAGKSPPEAEARNDAPTQQKADSSEPTPPPPDPDPGPGPGPEASESDDDELMREDAAGWSSYRYDGTVAPSKHRDPAGSDPRESPNAGGQTRRGRPRRAAAAKAAEKKKSPSPPPPDPVPPPPRKGGARKRKADLSGAGDGAVETRKRAAEDDAEEGEGSRRRGRRLGGGAEPARVRALLSASFDERQKADLSAAVARLGGATAPDVSAFTHFIAAPPLVRSKNVLCALAAGKPIVSTSWVDASRRLGRFAPAEDHLCRDRAFEKKLGFDLARTLEAARRRGVLAGAEAWIVPGPSARERKKRPAGGDAAEREMLEAVLRAAGAEVARRDPSAGKVTRRGEDGDGALFVAVAGSCAKEIARIKATGAAVHKSEAVLEAVARHKLDRAAHRA